jgi:diguanylate cyclase (GGDEF)-like protein
MSNAVSRFLPNLTYAVYLWCSVVILAFALSSVLILTVAGVIADEANLEGEKSVLRQDVESHIRLLARDQAQISHWDNAVRALSGRIDEDFVAEEIAGWLWDDFGIDTTVVVSADGAPAVTVHKDEILDPSEGRTVVAETADLVAQAQQTYMARRRAKTGGYMVPGNPLDESAPLYVADIRPVEGRISLVVAQAIIPDRDVVLPDGAAPVLVTLKPMTMLSNFGLHANLNAGGIAFVTGDAIPEGYASIPVGIEGDRHDIHAAWQTSPPSNVILNRSIAPLLGLLILASAVLLLVARRSNAALTALQESEAKNRFLAQHDPLTELPNRVQFDLALEGIIEKGQQDRCAILCVDLDRFKAVNDTFGHHAGDVVLKTIGARISRTIGDAGMTARIGGDEFIVLLYDELDREHVLQRCEQLIESVCLPIMFEGGMADVGASVGVAWWPDDALTAKSVIKCADEALYRAKEMGRGQACIARPAPNDTKPSAALREKAA